jgi:GLEYA domain
VAVTTPSALTTTINATQTLTVNSCPTPSSCNNQGLQYGAFYNDQGANTQKGPGGYPNYNPVYMKSTTCGGDGAELYYSDVTTSIGGIDNSCSSSEITVYDDSTEFPCDYFSLDHRGYLFAPIAGHYTFTVSGVDDIVLFWTGVNAQGGWTRDNADLVIAYGDDPSGNIYSPGDGSFTVTMTQGEYLPIRIIFGQAQNAAVFQISLTDPNGDVILDSNTAGSPYIIQYSCDGILAPPFVGAFGSEC